MPTEHPDTVMVRGLIADLTAWLDIDVHDPTSQVTGGGAIRYAESAFAEHHEGRPSLLIPSASYGMRAALIAAGARPGKRVLIPGTDWTATLSAVRSVGAIPVPVAVDPRTMTIDPHAAAELLDDDTCAVVACHLHGVPADIPALRHAAGDQIAIIEDCAQALGSTLDGRPVGTQGSIAVYSFANKAINAGEAAIVAAGNDELHDRLISLTAHPVRQILAGIATPNLAGFSMRVSPASAIQLAIALTRWSAPRALAEHDALRAALEPSLSELVLGADSRRRNAAGAVPLRGVDVVSAIGLVATPSTALDIRSVINGDPRHADAILLGAASPRPGLTKVGGSHAR